MVPKLEHLSIQVFPNEAPRSKLRGIRANKPETQLAFETQGFMPVCLTLSY
jgi:hypothetical protein